MIPETKPLTLLQVIPELNTGGAERTTLDIAGAIKRAGGRALVASEGGRLVPELERLGGELIEMPVATKNALTIMRNANKLSDIIRRENVDIIHARSRAPAWSAYTAAQSTNIPFVTTYHGAYNQKNAIKGFYNGVMARGDAVIANSRFTADLVRLRHHPPDANLHVVPRGIDLTAFSASNVTRGRQYALLKDWNISPEAMIILCPGRLTRWKGQEVFIEAARLFHEKKIDGARFVMAGDHQGRDDYRESLIDLIDHYQLSDRVHLVGHCSDMPAAYSLSQFVVVPSIEPEAFGRTAVEAQAMGKPVIVSDIGATPETVLAPPDVPPQQQTGWRFPPGDAKGLAAALWDALAMGQEAKNAMSLRAREHVEKRFSLEQMMEKTLSIYQRVLAHPDDQIGEDTSYRSLLR